MLEFLSIGLLLGLAAGLAPGPLLALVIAETLKNGMRSGGKVALAPLVSDLPVIGIALLLVARMSDADLGLGLISLAGGVFILLTGCQSLRVPRGLPEVRHDRQQRSLLKGVLANLLNPHPYLFWIGVGAPMMSKALVAGQSALVAFLVGFYAMLVGSKLLLALLVSRSRLMLLGRGYRWTVQLLGLVLCCFALLLFRDGLRLLGLL